MKMVTLAIGGSDIELKYNDNKNGLGGEASVYIQYPSYCSLSCTLIAGVYCTCSFKLNKCTL